MSTRLTFLTVSLAVALLGLAGTADARMLEGATEVDFSAGSYVPGAGDFDPAFALGVRGGRNLTENYRVQVGMGYARMTGKFDEDGTTADLRLTLTFIDLAFVYHILPRNRWVTTVHAGPSWALADLFASNIMGDPLERQVEGLRDNTVALHWGVGGKYDINRSWSIVPTVRWRWLAEREEEAIDTEIMIGVGWSARD